MQRFFRFCVLAICLALTGCSGGLPTASPAEQTAAAAPTVPPPTAVPIPPEKAIVQFTNDALERLADPLAKTLDANYQVLDVHFTGSADGLTTTFLIEARCECVNNNDNCCMLERTFVTVVNAMKAVHGKIGAYAPANVGRVQISCRDHGRPLGIVEVSWNDLQSYFAEMITGSQFGSRATIFPAP